MSYYCELTDINFNLKAENIEKALEKLIESDYFEHRSFRFKTKEDCLSICKNGTSKEVEKMFSHFMEDFGYLCEFDKHGNVCNLCHEKEKWYEDTDFFAVFGEYVEKGSYIEFEGEDHTLWSIYFDGTGCEEVSPIFFYPYENSPDKYKVAEMVEIEDTKNALECLDYDLNNMTVEDFKLIREELYNRLANDDTYNTIYNETLQTVMMDFLKEKLIDLRSKKPSLEEMISSVEHSQSVNQIKGNIINSNFKVGDVCTYSFDDEKDNKSLARVEIVKILDDPRGIAEIKFREVMVDDTGNGFFNYLLKTGKTMNASLKYLQKNEKSKENPISR